MTKKQFKTNGFVIWNRNTTPMEDGQCVVHRSRADAVDLLKQLYVNWEKEEWRIGTLSMTADVPGKKSVKAKVSRKKGNKKDVLEEETK